MYIVFDYFFHYNDGFTIKDDTIKVFDNINNVKKLNIFRNKTLDLLNNYWYAEHGQSLCIFLNDVDLKTNIIVEMRNDNTNIEIVEKVSKFNFSSYIRKYKLKKINNESRNLF